VTTVTVAGSKPIYGGRMLLGVYLALGVFTMLVGCVFALKARIDRIAYGLHRRIDDLSEQTWLPKPSALREPRH
jgi:hypothetical protein